MPTTEKTQRIISSFNRNDVNEINNYSINDLKEAIVDLAWRNEGDKRAIQYEIDNRENNEQKKYNSKIRAVSYIVALAIALIAGLIFL